MDRQDRGGRHGEALVLRAAEMRELVAVTIGGLRLRGTYHKAHPGLPSNPQTNARIGVLFLNTGVAPRAAGGDAAVDWADSFSKRGYPCFRFDLPGLGDSEGRLPLKLQDFAEMVDAGCYTPFICGIAKEVTEGFQLSGVVLVGNCTGAVSAIYAATECGYIKGVVALDPYFFRKERKVWRSEIGGWTARNRVGGQLKNIYDHLKRIRMLVRKNELPDNANLPLIRCWNDLASAALPVLVLNARGSGSRVGEFDYFGYFDTVIGYRSHVVVKFIEGAQHSFADRLGRVAVRQHTEQWLRTFFPLGEHDRRPLSGALAATARR
jgi:pimeloyl-ACP methyl ester carboxylesterase